VDSHEEWKALIQQSEDNAIAIQAGGDAVELVTIPNRISIGLEPGAQVELPQDLKWVRDITPDVRVYETESSIDANYVADLDAIDGVAFTTSVFLNTESLSEAVLLNEVIVALQSDMAADDFFAQRPEFSAFRPLEGTSDQYVATVRSGYGKVALDVGNAIANAPGVAWTSPNFYQTWQKNYSPNDPRFLLGNQWHLNNTGQGGGVVDADSDLPEAWDLVPGGSSNLVVAVIDDGVQSTHPDLKIWVNPGEIAGDGIDNDSNGWIDDINGWNFVFDTNNSEPLGSDRHGTSVGGVAAARGDNALGVAGAAYNAQLMSLKMFDGNFVASDANIASALYYAAGRTKNGLGTWKSADIVNNSWGGGGVSTAINAALTWGTTLGRQGAGATYFFSSGNDFSNTVGYPSSQSAVTPGVISIGATNNFAQRSNYSNYGTDLDFVTPSNDTRTGYLAIDTTDRTSSDGYSAGDYTGTGIEGFGGTSSAAPLASGIATLVLSRAEQINEPMSPAKLRTYLRNTTDLFGGYVFDIVSGKNIEVGYGRLNAATAVQGVGKAEISVVTTTNELLNGDTFVAGSANLGRTNLFAFRVRNQGTKPLVIADNTLAAPYFIDAGIAGATIDVGESLVIRGRFSPTTPGVHNGQLTITSNDSDEASFVINLVGNGISTAISGEFFEDFSGDGLRAASDALITETAFAYLDANDNAAFDAGETRAFTDTTGYYAFLTLPAGTYKLRGSVPGWTSTSPATGVYDITITGPSDFNVGKDFGFAKNGRMYGYVFHDVDRNGNVNAGETGVGGQFVFLDANTNGVYNPLSAYPSTASVPIPDLTTVTSTITVTDTYNVADVNVRLNINHTFIGDLIITLISPLGTRIRLVANMGSNSPGYVNTVFDDEAASSIYTGSYPFTGSFIPDSPLRFLDGESVTGDWKLEVADVAGGDSGILASWALLVEGREIGRTSNAEGYVGIDLPAGNSQMKLITTGSWDYTIPANGVRNVTRTAGPVRGVNFGVLFNNVAPTNLTLSSTSVVENSPVDTLVGTLSTVDSNANDFFVYSLASGVGSDDNAKFRIVGNQLLTNAPIDFEITPVLLVRIRTTDSGGLVFERAFTINVTNLNEPGSSLTLSGSTLPENALPGYLVGTLGSDDPDGNDAIDFRFVNSGTQTDNGLFRIVGNRLESAVTFDKEARSNYSIRIRGSDRFGLAVEQVFVINVTDMNESPSDISLSNDLLTEGLPAGAVVGTFAGVDPDVGDSLVFSLVAGTGSTDNAKFAIVGNQLRSASLLDFETQRLLSIRVRATDALGLTFEKTFVIALLNINEVPTDIVLTPNSVNEGAAIGTRVGDLRAIDQDLIDGHRFEFVDTANFPDASFFRIVGSEVTTTAVFDFDTKNSYLVRVRATDQGGLVLLRTITILVNNVNELPSDVGLDNRSIDENKPVGTLVGNLSTVDADGSDTFTYSFVAGAGSIDNARFSIVGSELRSNNVFNFETAPRYFVRIQSRDSGGAAIQRAFTISINNVNEAPTAINVAGASVPENAAIGTSVSTLTTSDPDVGDTFQYSFVNGSGDQDNAKFVLVGNQLQTNETLNFEQIASYSVRVKSTDAGGLAIERQVTIAVSDVNEAPLNLRISSQLIDGLASGNSVGTVAATDPDVNDSLTFTLVAGAGSDDNAAFTLSPVGGLTNLQTIDFETQPVYQIRVRATDAAGLFVESAFTLDVTNVNERPTELLLSANTVPENNPVGLAVGQLTTQDPDINDAFSYTLVSGAGSDDNQLFSLVANQLRAEASFDFETKSSYSVRVRSTDIAGEFIEQSFVISVRDQNEAPATLSISNASVLENAAVGSLIGLLTTADVDAGDTFVYSLVDGVGSTDNSMFSISDNQLQSAAIFDFETKSSYTVRVRSTDRAGLFTEATFSIQILDGNDPPTNFSLSNSQIDENASIGALIGLLSAIDSDGTDTIQFRMVPGNNDNQAFALAGPNSERLVVSSPLDFETRSTYRVELQAYDSTGTGPIRSFVLSVNDVNESPSDIQLSSSAIDENLASNSSVGSLIAVDPDSGASHVYALIDGVGSNDNGLFSIVNGELFLLVSADFEAKPTYSIRVRATDQGGLVIERPLTISINDIAESPTDLRLSNNAINENLGNSVTVGALSASDPDAGTALVFTLVSGSGAADNALFSISGSNLIANQPFNFEASSTRQVRVRATDSTGLSVEQSFTIVVNDLPEAPTSISLSNASILENQPSATLIGSFTTVDPDANATHTYAFAANGNPTGLFEIVGNQLRATAKFNFEAQPVYSVTVRSTDTSGLFVETSFVIQVIDVLELPANALADSSTTQTSRPVIIDVLQNDVDPDGTIDPSTVTIVTAPAAGSARVLADGRIEFTPPADQRDTYTFSYRVLDNDGVASNAANVSVRVYSAFQNQRSHLDVDDDGNITPLDVLAILNDINVFGVRTLPTNVPDTLPFVDTNGNGQSDPLDVLEVVNFLNASAGGSGEGEASNDEFASVDAAMANLNSEPSVQHTSEQEMSMMYADEQYLDWVLGKNRRR
jgi:subtilisin-like proprotein convertase family protein